MVFLDEQNRRSERALHFVSDRKLLSRKVREPAIRVWSKKPLERVARKRA